MSSHSKKHQTSGYSDLVSAVLTTHSLTLHINSHPAASRAERTAA
jgi:hypothetical protein